MYLGVEVPLNRIQNIVMEIKIDKGDLISDGFEEGMVCGIRKDGGDMWYDVWDGKEGWSINLREIVKVNGEELA